MFLINNGDWILRENQLDVLINDLIGCKIIMHKQFLTCIVELSGMSAKNNSKQT